MDKEQAIIDYAVLYNLPVADVRDALNKVTEALINIAGAMRELVKRAAETIRERESMIATGLTIEQPAILFKYLYLLKVAHRFAIEEDKKPPDKRAIWVSEKKGKVIYYLPAR